MRSISVFIATVLVSIACSTSAYAWPDGQREGLLLGITAGLGNAEFSNGSTTDGTAKMVGLYIGAGLNEQLLISFRYRYVPVDTDTMNFHTFAWTGDIIYFVSPTFGLFLNAGFGRALVAPEQGTDKSGTTYYLGIGYEITKWVFIMADYTKANLEDSLEGSTMMIAVTVMGY